MIPHVTLVGVEYNIEKEDPKSVDSHIPFTDVIITRDPSPFIATPPLT
jgi:hypothetical protein